MPPKDGVTSFRMLRWAAATAVARYQCTRAKSAATYHSKGPLLPDQPPGGLSSGFPHSCGALLHVIHPPAVFLPPCPEHSKSSIDGPLQPRRSPARLLAELRIGSDSPYSRRQPPLLRKNFRSSIGDDPLEILCN